MVEACEYKRHFLYLDLDYSIITNIELDHTDYDLDGKFKITYICDGSEKAIFLANKKWDGLDKVLECLISKIS